MPTWSGTRRLAVIPAITNGAGSAPSDFQQRVIDRIFFDPAPTTGVDRSLRAYIHAVSYGRASLDAQIFPPATVTWAMHGNPPQANPGQTMADAIAAAGPAVSTFPFVMVVFPAGITGVRSWAFWGGSQGRSYVLLDNPIGAWAMELLHIVTEFGDLYGPPPGRSPSPGAYDEMDASSGTHPSVFTKLRMGWLDASSVTTVQPHPAGATFLLHPLSRLQPPPQGRVSAIRIPIGPATRYLLAEARESLDDYDRATPDLSSGVPKDGVIVYDVDESIWPPLWLRVSGGLEVGQTFSDTSSQTELSVVDHLAGGGFHVRVRSSEPARCDAIRQEIATLAGEISMLQEELKGAAPGEKPAIAGRIKALNNQVNSLKREGTGLRCRL